MTRPRSPLRRFRTPLRRGVLALVLLSLWAVSPVLAQRYTVQEAGLDGGGGLVTTDSLSLTSSLGGSDPVGTARTERYVLYSGMPSPFAGQLPILVIHDPAEDGRAVAEGEDRTVTARIVTNNAPLESATMYYRSGNDDEPTAVSMAKDETGFVAVIPGADIGETGLTYYFVATDAQGTTIRAPKNGVYSLPVQLEAPGVRKPGTQTGGTTKSAYRLLSMPIVLDDPSPEAVLGDDIPSLASASAYDPSTARLFEPIGTRVAEFPGTGDFELGRAFWLIVREEVEAIDTGPGMAKVLNEPVRIDLSQGWNFVGTPFPVEVPIDNVETTDGTAVTLRSYGPDGYNTPDDPVTAMTPFAGYAVFAETATTLVVNPPRPEDDQSKQAALVANASDFSWRLRIRGTSPAGRDADNVAAVHDGARDGWDVHDWPEPPALASDLTIAFDPPEGAPDDVTLSADVRSTPTQGRTWPLTVQAEVSGTVRLSVDGVEQVPATFEVWLLDVTTKETWNLRRTPRARLDVLTDGGERPLRLVVGTSAYVQDVLRDLEALPQQYALEPPYPNPSVGPVAFQVGLPKDDRVTVEVYNVLGQRVATLKDRESMPAGFHTIVWDAPRLASGMYFVRMEAGSYRKTQKLVRIR